MKNCQQCHLADISHKAKQARYCDDCAYLRKLHRSRHANKQHTHWGRRAAARYRRSHPGYRAWFRRLAKGQAIKEQRPSWVDKEAIEEVYRNRPEGMSVDHIVPLQGNGVMGLHVPWNLQYLPEEVNRRKGNRV